MQISKMNIGTMYLVNERRDWKTWGYDNKAYILMSLEPFEEQKLRWSSRYTYATVTINGTNYSYGGRPWLATTVSGSKLYLMQHVDPDTREPVLNEQNGKPFLSLISTRSVRGEWAVAKAEQEGAVKEKQERSDRERVDSQNRWNRAEGIAIRLRSLLGLNSNAYQVNTADVGHGYSGGGPRAIKISMNEAEKLADMLGEAHQEIEDLKAELRDLRG
jgi:hypothetical protein